MTNSSPLRRSQLLSSPDRGHVSSFLLDDRNTELTHRDALAAAQAEHDRVRETALRVFDLYNLKEERNRILEQERREQERLKAEAEIAAEEKRLQELRAKSIPRPPPPKPEPEPVKPVEKQAEEKKPAPVLPEAKDSEAPSRTQFKAQQPNASLQQPNGPFANLCQQAKSGPVGTVGQKQDQPQQSPAPDQNKPSPAMPSVAPTQRPEFASSVQPSQQKSSLDPLSDRYIQIHQALKQLRKDLATESKVAGSPLKGSVGFIRRELRVTIGQLTGDRGANVHVTSQIMALLRQSLDGQLPSPMVDGSQFVATPRQPSTEDVPNNGPTIPSLFVYSINIIAKGIIGQFINECKANPKAADPIGVFTAQVFSHKDFSWRGQSLMDILLAKFRVACPVLFGSRGNDKSDMGKQALGWKRDGPSSWVEEHKHHDIMAGLGTGFASISLRDFSKASKANPYPPTNYWKAFACIVNSPPNEISDTQLVVLRFMINGYEQRFLNFYGNAAVVALRLALVEFPKKAPANSSSAGSLRALGETLRSVGGLALA
ncbi:hypothetical protein C2857_005286 [Epichloe festucae Fl1]|uniref:mRNA export factor GLE1 n=1 Tax=Epichloe festucae (strain Fl1) TaxID=877507 RepID=A0A7S9KPL0_EPIFF|nr:hypothetical protein C2857_005286 [Epichloe festucae Fl1]